MFPIIIPSNIFFYLDLPADGQKRPKRIVQNILNNCIHKCCDRWYFY